MTRSAVFSPDRMFRYTLKIIWDNTRPRLLVIMLNPSVADEQVNDPTITRVLTRAKAEGFGGIVICNLYAFRSPYPAKLLERYATGNEVIGRGNDQAIMEAVAECDAALVAWGSHKLASRRDQHVLELLQPLADNIVMLELTASGFPKHPLHVAYKIPFSRYKGRFSA